MKKQTSKTKLIALAFCLAGAFFLINCSSSKTDLNASANAANGSGQISAPATTISAVDLYNAYKKDQSAADARFKGKTVQVSGEIFLATEKSITGVPVAAFKADNKDGVSCKFPESQKDAVGKLKEGQTATFKCQVKGAIALSSFYGVELNECAIE
ncbi:MAG: OB-fold protein [Pyrinomonadaceae bacterium]